MVWCIGFYNGRVVATSSQLTYWCFMYSKGDSIYENGNYTMETRAEFSPDHAMTVLYGDERVDGVNAPGASCVLARDHNSSLHSMYIYVTSN